MSRERAQALVEAVVAVPACIACALGIVDAGLLVRDRIALAQAADRAAIAHLDGRDEAAAARAALPETRIFLMYGLSEAFRSTVTADGKAVFLNGKPAEVRAMVTSE